MKKLRIIAILFILTFSFSVKADVFMEIDCNSKDIANDNSVTCEGNLIHERVSIDDIDFEYVTNLDVEFIPVSGFSLNKNGNKVTIHSDTSLYERIMGSNVIMKFKLSANTNCKDKESMLLKNFMINKTSSVSMDDVSETFNVTVPQKLDSDCLLTNLSVDKVDVKDFSKNKFEYRNIITDHNVVFVDATRSSDKSSVTGLGQVSVKPGETLERDVISLAEDGTKCVYKLYITNESSVAAPNEDIPINKNVEIVENKPQEEAIVADEAVTTTGSIELNSDNNLKNLELYNGKDKIAFNFDSSKTSFDIKLKDIKIEKISIKAVLSDSKASFVKDFGPRDVKLSIGDNKILIKVKALNGDEKVYTLNINYQNDISDASLSSLKVNDVIVELVDGITEYEVTVPEDTLKSKIEAVTNSDKAKVNYEDIELVNGDNKIVLEVVSSNGDKKEYHLNIIRAVDKEINITVDGYELEFSKIKKDYTLKIDENIETLKINIIPEDSTYEILNNEQLKDGSIIIIKIDSNDIYRIHIVKESNKSNKIYYLIGGIGIVVLLAIILVICKKKKKNEIEII